MKARVHLIGPSMQDEFLPWPWRCFLLYSYPLPPSLIFFSSTIPKFLNHSSNFLISSQLSIQKCVSLSSSPWLWSVLLLPSQSSPLAPRLLASRARQICAAHQVCWLKTWLLAVIAVSISSIIFFFSWRCYQKWTVSTNQ